MKINKIVLSVLVAIVLITSCTKDTPVEIKSGKIITTMRLTFVPIGGGVTSVYEYDDPDGSGGSSPIQDEIILAPNTSYNAAVVLLNKTQSPAVDITAEVQSKADSHRLYYEPTTTSNITVLGLNNDGNGIPLGTTSTWTTGAVATGKVKVTLRYYPGTVPNKAAGDLVNSSKSGTDIQVDFTTIIR